MPAKNLSDPVIDSRDLISILVQRWRAVLLPVVIGTACAFWFAAVQPPLYRATATLLAGQGRGIADVTQSAGIGEAATALAALATAPVVVDEAVERGLLREGDAEDLPRRLSSRVPPETQQIEITVENTDPRQAAREANAVARAFSRLVEQRAAPGSDLSATLWQPALAPSEPSAPKPILWAAAGALLGLLVGAASAGLWHIRDRAWKNQDDLERALGVPVLGILPDYPGASAPIGSVA